MKQRYIKSTVTIITIILSLALSGNCEWDLKYDKQVFNFGHMGIDFKVYHTYKLFNLSDKTYHIDSLDVNCSCSSIKMSDTVIHPGDTVLLKLAFDSKNYFGPTNKSFIVYTDYELMKVKKFYYQATIGQWHRKIKPNPISLFFLPGHGAKKITIPNRGSNELQLVEQLAYDSCFLVNVLSDNAKPAESIVLEIAPHDNISHGTHQSNLTLRIDDGINDSAMVLTIPIRIDKY